MRNFVFSVKMISVLLTDQVHKDFPQMLKDAGFRVRSVHVENEEELQSHLEDIQVLIVRNAPRITSLTLDRAIPLLCIARAGSGLENIDYSRAMEKGIAVLHSPEGNSDAVAEHALGLVLCLLKRICVSNIQVKKNQWLREQNRGVELNGKKVGIIGFGNTGSAFARRLSSMGVEIFAFDKFKSGFGNEFVTECTLQDLFVHCDIVSFHVPLTDDTLHYGNALFFNRFVKPIMLINTSRGKVVSSSDLVDAMKAGKVFAAGLDVLETETCYFEQTMSKKNAIDDFLLQNDQVIITPHIAGITVESKYKHAQILTKKLKDLFKSSSF